MYLIPLTHLTVNNTLHLIIYTLDHLSVIVGEILVIVLRLSSHRFKLLLNLAVSRVALTTNTKEL